MAILKTVGLAGAISVILMTFAMTASATRFTSPAGTLYTGTIKAESTNLTLTNSSTIGTISCGKSLAEGTNNSHGVGVTDIVIVTNWWITSCTGGESTHSTQRGSWEFHLTTAPNGTWTSNGWVWTIHKTIVGTCTFATKNTDLGTFKGGTPAKLEIGSSPIPQESGNFFCPSSATLSGTYTITSPGTLVAS
ncbi:MAG TPA: hypothetical protein VFJ61_10800 [Solirubrobacterales bacterium]|nr:hypothetical protein [Solirubrobacterales bacterium]